MNVSSHRDRWTVLWKAPDGTTIAVRHELFAGATDTPFLQQTAETRSQGPIAGVTMNGITGDEVINAGVYGTSITPFWRCRDARRCPSR